MRPLRRKPKRLDEAPTAFDVAGGGKGGTPLPGRPGEADGRKRPSGSGAGFTDDIGSIAAPDDAARIDPVVRARAREIAARLSVPKPKADRRSHRGGGAFASVPYSGSSDDIDLDATLQVLAERPVPEDEDVVVRERVRAPRSVVLLVDVSGSMRGERVRTAAATVGALAGELERDRLAVIAFWSDAAILSRLGEPVRPLELLDGMLRLPARGLTNVAFPLELAAKQLASTPPRNARVVLLSDCVHNAGPDPRPLAGRLPRLDVLLDTTGEQDVELGRDLARIGRGSFATVRTVFDVAPALSAMFRARVR
ncbi:VWA domain-containing protein [uncultured Amnibacterium sp.]|uniref:vWA domain-containing protein n=1 Tax=uncultured Amnibacterium sp. TaxID=1631851 RepID=UPI0035CB484A